MYGPVKYNDNGRAAVEISLPHILRVTVFPLFPGGQLIRLFNASANAVAANNGNLGNVTVTYVSNNPAVPFTYQQLLSTTLSSPMVIGTTRIQTMTRRQGNTPFYWTRNVGVGNFDGNSAFPLVYPNQTQSNIAYVTEPYLIDRNTGLSYQQYAVSDGTIQLYFYPSKNIDLARAFNSNGFMKEFGKPQTSMEFDTDVKLSIGEVLL